MKKELAGNLALANKLWGLKTTRNDSLARLNDLVKEIEQNPKLSQLQQCTSMINEARETEPKIEKCINSSFRRAMISASNKLALMKVLKKDAAASKSMHTFITEIETHITTYQSRVKRIGKMVEFELSLEKTP